MSDCCTNTTCEIEKLQAQQSKTLLVVLIINAGMFIVEFVAGLMASSTALLADSLDMLGDTLVYGFSLYVVSRNDAWKAVSAFIKSGVMVLFGLFVFAQVVYKFMFPAIPHFETIGLIGFLALIMNAICLKLLWSHRTEDVNMRSVWICSRNDIIANSSVIVAGIGVWLINSQWPDIIVGIGIAILFLRSSYYVFKDATTSYKAYNSTQQ